ncbi:MAG: ACP S-malonyltransferase [Actinobacteria bacterium]|nr:ACP S-malonyltransferase [Actinomycetota bacterium]
MIAFTFPGQGSQKPGIGGVWRDHPSWELVNEARQATGRDVPHLLLDASAEELKATRNAQLSTFVASLVVLDAVERLGVEPAAVAGHSLGEYTALTASGALSFEDGCRLVTERGEAMQSAAEEHAGTMAAVLGLDDGDVEVACAGVDGDVWVANYNGPGQVVIAGDADAIASAGEIARQLGAKRIMPIPVGGAFHTPYMAPARDRLRKAIDETEIRSPEHPVVANVDGRVHEDGDEWRGLLNSQLCRPVRWRQSLHTLAELGVTKFVELGPGTVLTGLAKRTIDGSVPLSVATPDELDRLLSSLTEQSGAAVGMHEGEHLFAAERVVVSPAAGVFDPDPSLEAGTPLHVGHVLGRVGDQDVRSPFTGTVAGVLALAGERVSSSQPIAWLRTA